VQDSTLWAATLGGVVAWNLNDHTPTLYGPRDGLADIQANSVAYCPKPVDRVYVAHASTILSVYDLSLKKWSRLPITFEDGSAFRGVQTLFCDVANRRLLAGSPEGIGVLNMDTGLWRKIGPERGLRVDGVRSIDVAGQAIWVAAGDEGAFLIQGNSVFPFDAASGFPSGRVNDLSVAADKSLWLGYSNGLVHYMNKKWIPYGAQSSAVIPFQSVDFVQVGPDRRVWIASAEEGACPFDMTEFFCSTVYPGIRGAPVTGLVVGSNGVAYLATDGAGVLALHTNYVTQLIFPGKHLASDNVRDIAGDASGRLWVATDRGIDLVDPARPDDPWQALAPQHGSQAIPQVNGLLPAEKGMWLFYDQAPQVSFVDGENWLNLDASRGLSSPVLAGALDQRGRPWFATEHSLQTWDGAVLRTYTPPETLNPGSIRALLAVGDTLWVGADRGLLEYENLQWKKSLPDIPVNAIFADQNRGLLLGTDQGLVRFDGSQGFLWIINLGDKVVPSPKITSIARDGAGRLWVGTAGEGAFIYDGMRWIQFSTATGLPTDDIRKIYTDPLGGVWIAAVTGEGGGALVHVVP
jgi:ligand-binding sensor domain-containing protein